MRSVFWHFEWQVLNSVLLNWQEKLFWDAIQGGNTQLAAEQLMSDSSLAGRNFLPASLHSDGCPLFHATEQGNFQLTKLLLAHGADPNAALRSDDPRERGMPLVNAFAVGHLEIVDLLLDHGADVFAWPWCGTPFVDCLCNNLGDSGANIDEFHGLMRASFATWLNNDDQPTGLTADSVALAEDAPALLKLLKRVVVMGGSPTLFTVVRLRPMELITDLLRTCPEKRGTKLDWPQGTVFDNLCYGASWTGYPVVLDLCRTTCPSLYTNDVAKSCIERAIRSHNRDGEFEDYQLLIRTQLEFLKSNGKPNSPYSNGKPFTPLHWLAEDFIEPKNYGGKCQRLSTTDDLIELARLFIRFGVDAGARHPETNLTSAETAQQENQTEYVAFLKTLCQ